MLPERVTSHPVLLRLFTPDDAAALDLPRPIFMTVGRVAVEKNLEAFLSLDLPGSKVVIGSGPQKAVLERRYPKARFLGEKTGRDLTSHLAAADVFVFPSCTVLAPDHFEFCENVVESARIYAGQPLMRKTACAACVSIPG